MHATYSAPAMEAGHRSPIRDCVEAANANLSAEEYRAALRLQHPVRSTCRFNRKVTAITVERNCNRYSHQRRKTKMVSDFVAIDLLALIFPSSVYQRLVEKFHPNEPPTAHLAEVVKQL